MNAEMMMENRVENINDILDGMNAGFSVLYEHVPKNNVTRDALVMRPREDGVMSPMIYLNGELLSKTDGELASFLTEMYTEHRQDAPDLTAILARERILDTVLPRLVSAENASRLDSNGRVYEQMMDLLICYYIPVDEFASPDGSSVATIQITDAMLRQADVNMEELKEAALANMRKTVDIKSIGDVLCELAGFPVTGCSDTLPIFVVTNKARHLGAGAILLPDVREELKDKLGCESYYILPSSIHECLAVPADENSDVSDLLEMVVSINRSEVALEDKLNDSVYLVKDAEITVAA